LDLLVALLYVHRCQNLVVLLVVEGSLSVLQLVGVTAFVSSVSRIVILLGGQLLSFIIISSKEALVVVVRVVHVGRVELVDRVEGLVRLVQLVSHEIRRLD
jgi:hypothetical protein